MKKYLLAILFFSLLPSIASADIIYSQLDDSVQYQLGVGEVDEPVCIGNGFSGELTTVTAAILSQAGIGSLQFQVIEYTGANCGAGGTQTWGQGTLDPTYSGNGTKTFYEADFSSDNIVLNPSYYYEINLKSTAFGSQVSNGFKDFLFGTGITDPYLIVENNLTNNSSTTRIEWVNPPKTNPSANTPSRTVNYTFNYYLNTVTDSISNNGSILLQLCPLSYPEADCQRVTVTNSVIPNTFSQISITATSSYDGYYLGLVNFWNGIEAEVTCSWWQITCEETQAIVGKGSPNNFNMATTTLAPNIPLFAEGIQSMCDDTDSVAYYVCKAFVWMFIPDANTFEKYTSIQDDLRQKVPFNFYYDIADKIEILSTTEENLGTDVVVNLGGFIGTTTMFSWQEAHDGFADMIGETPMQYMLYVAWLVFAAYAFWRIKEAI